VLPDVALKLKLAEESKGEPGATAEALLVGEVMVSLSSSSSLTFCMLAERADDGLKEPPPPKGLVPGKVDSAIVVKGGCCCAKVWSEPLGCSRIGWNFATEVGQTD